MRVYLTLEKRNLKTSGEGRIKFAIAVGRDVRYISTPFSVLPQFWNERTQLLRKNALDSAEINGRLKKLLADYNRMLLDMPRGLSADDVRQRLLDAENEVDRCKFESVWNEYVALPKSKKTVQTYDYALTKIKGFGGDISWSMLDYRWLTQFTADMERKGLSKDTRYIVLHNLRAVCNYALRCGYIDRDIFKGFKVARDSGGRKFEKLLTIEQIKLLRSVDLDGSLAWCRDILLLSFVLGGVNLIDIFNMKAADDGIISYQRHKCLGHAPETIRLHLDAFPGDIAEWIRGLAKDGWLVDHRGRDFELFENTHKKAMQRLARLVGFPLSLYSFRYSWASLAVSHGLGIEVVDMVQGHKNRSVSFRYYVVPDWSAISHKVGEIAAKVWA